MAREPEDELLAALVERLREQESGLPDWCEKLATGEIDEAEIEVHSEKAARLVNAFRPLSPKTRANLAEAAAQRLSAARRPHHQHRRRPRARRFWLPAAGFAAAAAVALVFLRPAAELDATRSVLPAFTAEWVAGDAEVRAPGLGDDHQVTRLRQDSRLEWLFRPEVPVTTDLEVSGFVLGAAGTRRWPVRADTSSNGAVRLAGTPAELGLDLGRQRLVIAIGRRDGARGRVVPPTWPSRVHAAEGHRGGRFFAMRDVEVLANDPNPDGAGAP